MAQITPANTTTTTNASQQPPYPLHPSIDARLDPVYKAYYNAHIIDKQQVHLQPIAASRASGVLLPGASTPPAVGSVRDYTIQRRQSEGPHVPVRCFTPEGEAPKDGWPVVVWYHGGGWVLGNIDTENTVCANLCKRAGWVVVTPDYRLAPEHPFPAAVHDAWETLLWLSGPARPLLNLSPSKLVLAGSSAGGNLAAVMAQRIVSLPPSNPTPSSSSSSSSDPTTGTPAITPVLAQFLCVPVTDNTALPSTNASWRENEFAPALPAAKMLWYRQHYLPHAPDRSDPRASPLLWDGDWGKLPPAIVVVGELDVLRDEGVEYAERLRENGVETQLKVVKGMPHPFLAMDGVIKQGEETIGVLVEGLRRVG